MLFFNSKNEIIFLVNANKNTTWELFAGRFRLKSIFFKSILKDIQ